MRNFKLFTMILALMTTICFAACDDKDDNKQETNVCEPAACKMAEHATEMACDDTGHCVVKACADNFKVSDDKKSCEEVKESPKCDPAGTPACDPKCEDGNDCICREDRWQCVPVDDKDKCDPKCEDGVTKCVCTMDSCACAPVNPCAGKVEGDACGDDSEEKKGKERASGMPAKSHTVKFFLAGKKIPAVKPLSKVAANSPEAKVLKEMGAESGFKEQRAHVSHFVVYDKSTDEPIYRTPMADRAEKAIRIAEGWDSKDAAIVFLELFLV